MSLPVITDFRPVEPSFETSQSDGIEWLASAHTRAEGDARQAAGEGWTDDEAARFRRRIVRSIERVGCAPDHLRRRGHELVDFTLSDPQEMQLFGLHPGSPAAGMARRMELFQAGAERAFACWYPDDAAPSERPDDLIHVTCTGYLSPSAAELRMSRLGWGATARVSHAYHMGCYAALPAVRMASAYLALPRPLGGAVRVDVAHTELCTLHLNPAAHSPEQLVVQSLFADGMIRYSLRSAAADRPHFRVVAWREAQIPDSAAEMRWNLADWGMEMVLTPRVPRAVGEVVEIFFDELFAAGGYDYRKERGGSVFALHPGGPRIIDRIAEATALAEDQIAYSRRVLADRGNMSSATLPYIWREILSAPEVASGTLVASVAFGPGLTVSGGLLEKVVP